MEKNESLDATLSRERDETEVRLADTCHHLQQYIRVRFHIIRNLYKPCITEIYLHFICTHYGLYGNAPVQVLSSSNKEEEDTLVQCISYHSREHCMHVTGVFGYNP